MKTSTLDYVFDGLTAQPVQHVSAPGIFLTLASMQIFLRSEKIYAIR